MAVGDCRGLVRGTGVTGVAGTGLAAPLVSALSPSPSSIFSAVSPFVCARAPLAHANKALPTAVVEELSLNMRHANNAPQVL